jgi:IstB-like ATP binding protein
MTRASELAHLFRALKAPAAARALPRLAERAREEGWSYERFAEALLSTEVASRESHGGEARIRAARFPARKTLEEFDFAFQRSVRKAVVEHLGQLDFHHSRDNVVLLGPPGPGSHCPPRRRHWSNSPASVADTRMRSPLRRPVVTWTASSSPRWTLCNTVWRATPSRLAASASGR